MAKGKKESKTDYSNMDIDSLMSSLNKKYGEGSVQKYDRAAIVSCDTISTGVATLDDALHIGGVPKGRVIEIYGPESGGKTTLSLSIVAECQAAGGTAAFIDAEHALDVQWAHDIGVDVESLLISQPDSGEQALEICEAMVRSNKFGIIVVDSVAALVPKAEIDGEMGDAHVGLQARMISQGMRKLSGAVKTSNTCLVFINQLREKIGVMFGCLHADNLINFSDGKSATIKDVVDNKIKGSVWSYDEELDEFCECQITDWHFNGEVSNPEDYLSISIKGSGNKNGRMNIIVTPDHDVLTDYGWVRATDLDIGDKLITKQQDVMCGDLGNFLRGTLSGDSHISQADGHLCASLKIRDNIDINYAKWKANKLSAISMTKKTYGKYDIYTSGQFSQFVDIKEDFPNRDPMLLLSSFSWLGFAIWIMDDACYNRSRYVLSIKRLKGDHKKIDEISKTLDDLGLYHHSSYGGKITFDKDISDMIAHKIAKYVPICMRHKLPNDVELDNYCEFELKNSTKQCKTYAEVVDIRTASNRQMKNVGKYDISVDRCHNYSVGGRHNGVIVHNSPETTPGGRALKFYASVRLDVRRTGIEKDGDTPIGSKVRVKVVKNKVAPPFSQAEFVIYYGKDEMPVYGPDKFGSILDMAVDKDIVGKSGSWYEYNGDKIGNGRTNAVRFLQDSDSVSEEIKAKLADLRKARVAEVNEADEVDEIKDEDTESEGD